MQPVPRIFVSATSRDLRTARGLVAEGLRRMECMPIVQDDFPPDYKSVRDMLRTKIQTCNAVVHLAGFYYGAEPQPVIPGSDRRSFTQMEYEIAMELKLPCYVFLCGKDFPFDKHDPEPEEKQALQLAHRDRLLKRDELFYEFATPEELANRTRELQLSVEGLRGELAKERFRRRMTLAACIVLFLVGGGYFFKRMQKSDGLIAETNAQVQKQSDLIAQLLAEQKRLREAAAGTTAEIVKLAEVNVAKANKQSVEEVQRGVKQALAEAKAAVAAAGADKTALASALNKLIDAENALGHANEVTTAMEQLQKALDRDANPEEWAELTDRLVVAQKQRSMMSEEPVNMIKEAVQWATNSPKLGKEHPVTLKLMTGLAPWLPEKENIAMLRKIAQINAKRHGPDAVETLNSLANLARPLSEAAKGGKDTVAGEEADDIYIKLIAACTKVFGPNSNELLKFVADRSQLLMGLGKLTQAEEFLHPVIAALEEQLGDTSPKLFRPLNALAYVKEKQKDFGAAIALRRRLLDVAVKSNGPDSDGARFRASDLAATLWRAVVKGAPDKAALLDEAEKIERKLLDDEIRLHGAGQPDTLSCFEMLARILKEKGDLPGFLAQTTRRLEEMGKATGPDDTGYAFELNLVAEHLAKEDDLECKRTALKLASQALDIDERIQPKESRVVVSDMETVVKLHLALKQDAQADTVLQRELQLREKYHQKDTKSLALACARMSDIRQGEGKDAEALIYARKALDHAPHERLYRLKVERMLKNGGDVKGLIAMHLGRLEKMGKALGPADTLFANDLSRTGLDLSMIDDADSQRAGLKLQQQALAIWDRKLPKESVEIVTELTSIGYHLMKFREYEQAEPIVRREIELREKYHAKDTESLSSAYYQLYKIMEKFNRDAEAAVYARKALEHSPDSALYKITVRDLKSANQPQPAQTSAPAEKKMATPTMEEYFDFRMEINDKVKQGKLAMTTMNLPAETGRTHTIQGAWNGDKMERAYESNAKDGANGTFTSYYFNQHGALMSIYRVREGVDVPVKDVKKATDTFNFFERKLVGWKRTQDAAEKVEDPGSDGFAKKGQETYDAAQAAVSALLKAGPKQK